MNMDNFVIIAIIISGGALLYWLGYNRAIQTRTDDMEKFLDGMIDDGIVEREEVIKHLQKVREALEQEDSTEAKS